MVENIGFMQHALQLLQEVTCQAARDTAWGTGLAANSQIHSL